MYLEGNHEWNKKNRKYSILDIIFCQITAFIKVCVTFCFSAPYPLIDRFYKNISIKGSGAQNKR